MVEYRQKKYCRRCRNQTNFSLSIMSIGDQNEIRAVDKWLLVAKKTETIKN